MSTNYYLRRSPDPCPTCGQHRRADEIHIGLSGAGWVFLWRGWRAMKVAWSEDEPVSPIGVDLTSPSGWFAFLAEQLDAGGVIVDEYDHKHTLEDFTQFVISKREPRLGGTPPSRHSDLKGAGDCVHVDGDDVAFYEFS